MLLQQEHSEYFYAQYSLFSLLFLSCKKIFLKEYLLTKE